MNTTMRAVVVNTCHGGFSLSDLALAALGHDDRHGFDLRRDDPQLVAIVRGMGRRAWGACAELAIVEIPADVVWEIEEYDGAEHVSEVHRRWFATK